MERSTLLRRSLLVACVPVLAALGGCTDVNGSLYIVHNMVPNDDCTIPAESEVFRARGVLDLDEGRQYIFTPQIKNGAAAVMGTSNQHILSLRGADIELQAAPTQASQALIATLPDDLRARTQIFSGSVNPGGGSTGVAFPIIDTEQAAALDVTSDVEITVKVEVFGDMDNDEVTSTPFYYPVVLCNGCLNERTPPDANPDPLPLNEDGEFCPLFFNQL